MVILKKAYHIVKPPEPTPEEVMYVSECDQIKSLTHAPVVYFYRPTTDTSLEEAVQILKDSLGKALVTFYPLAGRLHWIHNGGGRVELHCNSTGALLVEAESDLRIDDFGDFRPTPEIRSLIPPADFAATPLHEVPVMLAQVTRFRCGGISLGTGISHILADGQGASHFISTWTKIARGEVTQVPSDDRPFLDRKILQLEDQQTDLALPNLKLSDFFPLPLVLGQSDDLKERKKETAVITPKLTKQQIEALRSKANGQYSFSRFEAVSAHIWKCMSMARGLKPEQETVLFVSADFRNRIKPPLPKRYFGNAVLLVPVASTVDELLSKPLSYAARKIRTAVENVSDEYVRSYLNCIKSIPDVTGKRHFHTVGCALGSFFGNPNLMVTSWVGLAIHGAHFGWGDEVYLGPGSLGYDGKVFLIPCQNGDGSFLVPLRLQVEHVSAFEKYFNEEI